MKQNNQDKNNKNIINKILGCKKNQINYLQLHL